jgi:hypothetical protein
MQTSISKVVTPIPTALIMAGIVFSGIRPLQPRWPCLSKAPTPPKGGIWRSEFITVLFFVEEQENNIMPVKKIFGSLALAIEDK